MSGLDDAIDRDTLLTRIIDAEATPGDWAAFRALAAREPAVWSELAEMQREHDDLAGALAAAIAVADRVEIPVHEHHAVRPSVRLRGVSSWGGWLAAAGLLLAFTIGAPRAPQAAGPAQSASLLPTTPEEALQRYLDLGREAGVVVGQAPELIVLDSVPVEGGEGFEVTYLRQVIEKRRVRDLYRVAQDELGNPVRVPVPPDEAMGLGVRSF